MSFHYGSQHYAGGMPSHNNHSHNHHGRRRGPRVSSAQNAHRQQFARAQRTKEVIESPASNAYAKDYEAARSFDFEDDEIFCPFHLLTDDDVWLPWTQNVQETLLTQEKLQSIHSSSSSDRSSLSSGSPEGSPVQQSSQPTPSFLLSTPSNFNQASFHSNAAQHHRMKLHQPLAQRSRNAIPIVDPSTRSAGSPPLSVSPARQMQNQYGRRW